MKNPVLAARLQKAMTRAQLGQSELARRVDMKPQGIQSIAAGGVERPKKLREIAAALGTSEAYLLGETDLYEAPAELQRVPLGQEFDPDPEFDNPATIGSETGRQGVPKGSIAEIDVTAGLGAGGLTTVSEATATSGMRFAAEVVRAHWTFPEWFMARLNLKPEWSALFPSQGDSMFPTILDGDVIVVDTRHRVPSPPGIYALTDQFGGVIFKRLEVVSANSDPEVMVKVASDNPRHETVIRPLSDIYIIGRFVSRMTSEVGR